MAHCLRRTHGPAAEEYQTMINTTDWRIIEVSVDGESFSLLNGKVEHYQRVLDLKDGILKREVVWESPNGKKLELCFERFISQTDQHLAVMRCHVKPLNFSGKVTITSKVDGNVRNYHHLKNQALDVVFFEAKNESGYILSKTRRTGFFIGVGVTHKTAAENSAPTIMGSAAADQLSFTAEYNLAQGETGLLEKYISVTTSRETDSEQIKSSSLLMPKRRRRSVGTSCSQLTRTSWKNTGRIQMSSSWAILLCSRGLDSMPSNC